MFNILVDSGFDPNLAINNTLLHCLIASSNLVEICQSIHRSDGLSVEEKMGRYNLVIDNIVHAIRLMLESGINNCLTNSDNKTPLDLLNREIKHIKKETLKIEGFSIKIEELRNLLSH